MSNRSALLLAAFALAAACAPPRPLIVAQGDVSERYQPALVHRAALIALADYPAAAGSGQVASDALERSLLASGYRLLLRRNAEKILGARELSAYGAADPARLQELGHLLGVNALAFGTVTDYTGEPDPTVLVDLPFEQADPVYGKGAARNWKGSIARPQQKTPSRVSLTVRLVDVETGMTLWSVTSSAIGSDLTSALDDAAASAMREVEAATIVRSGRGLLPPVKAATP
jgi:curli biogenesis system outer membrane secretion channel CsgG